MESRYNISQQLSQFEQALDSSFTQEEIGDNPPAVTAKTQPAEPKPAKAPAVLKVTLSKNQVKLNSNYYLGKENSKPEEARPEGAEVIASGKIVKINSS